MSYGFAKGGCAETSPKDGMFTGGSELTPTGWENFLGNAKTFQALGIVLLSLAKNS